MMRTEWGVEDVWGFHPVTDLASAENMVRNMQKAGYAAQVVWRGITEWQERDTLDD